MFVPFTRRAVVSRILANSRRRRSSSLRDGPGDGAARLPARRDRSRCGGQPVRWPALRLDAEQPAVLEVAVRREEPRVARLQDQQLVER